MENIKKPRFTRNKPWGPQTNITESIYREAQTKQLKTNILATGT